MKHVQKIAAFELALNAEAIDLIQLGTLCLHGIPDNPRSLRPACWRILLGFESTTRSSSAALLRKVRKQYYGYVNDLLVDPFIEASNDVAMTQESGILRQKTKLQTKQMTQVSTDPLCNDSKYKQYYNDNLTLYDIDKDVRRTRANLAFFQQEVPTSHLSRSTPHMEPRFSLDTDRDSIEAASDVVGHYQENDFGHDIKTKRTIFARLRHLNKEPPFASSSARSPTEPGKIMAARTSLDETKIHDKHWECVERILFVYAKLNPSISYTQGMSELIAPLYFVLANDTSSKYAEADCFGCFTLFM